MGAGLFLTPLAWGADQIGASYEGVVFSSQTAPGVAGANLSSLDLPVLGADGTLAFSGLVSVPASESEDVALFSRRGARGSAVRMIAGPDAGFFFLRSPSVSGDGRVAFLGERSVGEGLERGAYVVEPAGLKLLLSASVFGSPAFRGGTSLVAGLFADSVSEGEPATDAIGRVNVASPGKFASLAAVGDPAPGIAGHTISSVLGGTRLRDSDGSASVDASENGVVTFVAEVVPAPGPSPSPSPAPSSRRVVYAGSASSTLTPVAIEGDPAVGLPGYYYESFSTPTVASNGFIAFAALAGDGESDISAVYRGRPGALQLITRRGNRVVNAPAGTTFDTFFKAVTNETGDVIFDASIRYADFTQRRGIWIQRQSGEPVLIAVSGIRLPTPFGEREVESVDFAPTGTFNDLHQFVFRARFGDYDGLLDGIFLADTRPLIPWVRATYPRRPRDRVTRAADIVIRGTAIDDTGIAKVEYTVSRDGKKRSAEKRKAARKLVPRLAKGDRNWSFRVPLALGLNRIAVTATDRLGNVSEPLVLVILRY